MSSRIPVIGGKTSEEGKRRKEQLITSPISVSTQKGLMRFNCLCRPGAFLWQSNRIAFVTAFTSCPHTAFMTSFVPPALFPLWSRSRGFGICGSFYCITTFRSLTSANGTRMQMCLVYLETVAANKSSLIVVATHPTLTNTHHWWPHPSCAACLSFVRRSSPKL